MDKNGRLSKKERKNIIKKIHLTILGLKSIVF